MMNAILLALLLTIRPTLTVLALMTVLCGGIYPLVSTLALQALFPEQAMGSLIKNKNGAVLGSALIGQPFSEPKYFWGRLSATAPWPYNAAASSGSNGGAANPALLAAVHIRMNALKAADPNNSKPIPVDLVTASASGLDPHISVAAAHYQMARVANARGLSEAALQDIVARFTIPRLWGVFGEPCVNVLQVNLALDGRL